MVLPRYRSCIPGRSGPDDMSEIRVRNPALFDRLRIQALLRNIADHRGEDQMLILLQQALVTEFRRLDRRNAVNTACSEPQESS